MPLKFRKAMRYLREKYKVSDPDLLSIAKHFNQQLEVDPGTEWDEITRSYLARRRQRGKAA